MGESLLHMLRELVSRLGAHAAAMQLLWRRGAASSHAQTDSLHSSQFPESLAPMSACSVVCSSLSRWFPLSAASSSPAHTWLKLHTQRVRSNLGAVPRLPFNVGNTQTAKARQHSLIQGHNMTPVT